jgi:hypothetical protein
MLRRVNAGLFEEDEGADIELAVKASNNDGTEAAQFDYDSTVLDQDVVDGFPGCRFKVGSGNRQFMALVTFSPSASAAARYDLFQMNAAGALTPVGKSVTNSGGTPLIGFTIAGVPVQVPAPARARRKAGRPSRRKPQKRVPVGRSARRKPAAGRATRARRTAKRSAKRASSKKR